jgi:Carboxypeptidase regulatory-like domain
MTHLSGRFLAVFFFVFIISSQQSTSTFAGTTGTLGGYVFAQGGNPLQDARVSAVSPSQSATTQSDITGHFLFASLIPDTYSVTASKDGYQTLTQPGITIIADNTQNIEFTLRPQVATLAKVVVSGSVLGLLSPGTTQSVYNITPKLASTLSVLGGGTNLNQAYSAITAVPGAFVPPWQTGFNQPIFLRGGDFNEIGYELDGIPLNRTYDNIPTTNLSMFGQQALQVYTGGAPADAESYGLAGYINQVIKTGTVPGFADASAGIGSPALFNKFSLEAGGATPDRRFSYYFDVAGFNQDFRYADPFNGASLSPQFGAAFDLANAAFGPLSSLPIAGVGCPAIPNGSNYAGCYANHAFFGQLPAGPGGYVLGPYQLGQNSSITDRENVVNVHYSIPHERAGINDDVQFLYDVSQLYTYVYSSYSDWGGPALWTTAESMTPGLHVPGSFPVFVSGFQYTGALGQPVSGAPFGAIAGMQPYLFPSEDSYGVNGQIPIDQRDASSNAQALVKLQYQHDFGADEYVRVYGYSAYSNAFYQDPNFTNQIFPTERLSDSVQASDQELWTHTYGFSGEYAAQLNPAHLFSISASYLTSDNQSFNNEQMTNSTPGVPYFPPSQSVFAALVSTANPLNGTCYYYNPVTFSAPSPTSCEPSTPVPPGGPLPNFNTKFLTYGGPYYPAPAGYEWLAVENGPNGVTNSVKPEFSAFSLEDQWRPVNRVHVNVGVRADRFQYDLASTSGGPMTAFWFNEFNTVMCANAGVNGGVPIDETTPTVFGGPGLPPGTPCSALGAGWHNAIISNTSPASLQHTIVQPRLGATYEADVDDVLRLSLGSYAQPPQAQYEQYNTLQQNLADYIGPLYYSLGYTTPTHDLTPSVSYNYDFSWEHRFHRTDTSLKLTPFYRDTTDKVQQFFINPTSGIVSGVNAGKQTAYGTEFFLQSGSPERNGFSALFSYTYTYSRIRYGSLPNGSTLLSPVVSAIQLYNSYTKACASAAPSTSPTAPCGVYGPANAVATEASGVANPYYNAPLQALLDPNGSYPTYDVVPTGTQLSTASYGAPNIAVFALTYHHDQVHFTPLLQFISGSRYGAPEQQIGVDPATCSPLAAGSVVGDPRYPYGGSGMPYDATTCTNTIVIPDEFTGKFDSPGAFLEPSYIGLHAQLSYDISPRTTLNANFANIYGSCFGASNEPWVLGVHQCGYDVIAGHLLPVGNIYNPGDTIQRLVQYPYGNLFTTSPFQMYFDLNFKL